MTNARFTSSCRQESATFLGNAPAVMGLKRRLRKVARAGRTTLIVGETGTGKELVARTLHEQSRRRSKPFVTVHCGALPENLFESELFGHEKGAFTGAVNPRSGLVRTAAGGTLFLDEVNSLPLSSQSKLLRFLESGEYRSIGSDNMKRADTWVISATNEDLHERARAGDFRTDLLYRLEVIRLQVPPLNVRRSDILLLAEHFLNRVSDGQIQFSRDAQEAMIRYPWPGNVRELKHRVESAALLEEGRIIDAVALELDAFLAGHGSGSLGDSSRDNAPPLEQQLWSLIETNGMTLGEAVSLCERLLIRQALRKESDNRTKAAAKLGIHVRTIFKKLAGKTSPLP